MTALVLLQPSHLYLHLDFCDGVNVLSVPYAEGSLREWLVLRTLWWSLVPLVGKALFDNSPHLMHVAARAGGAAGSEVGRTGGGGACGGDAGAEDVGGAVAAECRGGGSHSAL